MGEKIPFVPWEIIIEDERKRNERRGDESRRLPLYAPDPREYRRREDSEEKRENKYEIKIPIDDSNVDYRV